ncbi:MAG: PilW family protein [candidate division WOR-3 bacterium]|nr:MAG: PilW family protein [candidate division WOR-3 bacterium]
MKIPFKICKNGGRLRSERRFGMTLVELMISLVILMVVLGAVYSVLNLQQTKSVQVTRTTILQTDAQVAFTLIKWDLLLAGLGYPYELQDALQLSNAGGDITLKGVGLGFEMNRTQWSYLLDDVAGSTLPVRRWTDSLANFRVGDTIIIMNETRRPVHQDLIITGIDTFTFYDPVWNNAIDGLRLYIGPTIAARAGLMVFRRNSATYNNGLTYTLSNDTLMRGGEALLTNVEAIQFRYGIDTDNDGIIDNWNNANNPLFNPNYGNKWAVRFTVVIASDLITGYEEVEDTILIEHDPEYPLALDPYAKRRKRAILSSIIYPQNLQPGEDL